jgi:hypothetical protein
LNVLLSYFIVRPKENSQFLVYQWIVPAPTANNCISDCTTTLEENSGWEPESGTPISKAEATGGALRRFHRMMVCGKLSPGFALIVFEFFVVRRNGYVAWKDCPAAKARNCS